ncbi:MAG: class I SAM-dependent methyltransferase [Pseudomonadota bacterium]
MSTRYLTEAAQDPAEIAAFIDLLATEGVSSFLEIGSKFGGSLWRIAQALPAGSRIVAIDLPGNEGGDVAGEASLKACIEALNAAGFRAEVIWGDSTDPKVIARAAALGPFDAVLIDANHSLEFVTRDFANYGALAGIVAFHDISWRRKNEWCGKRIEVPILWAALKVAAAKHQEIRLCPTIKNNGIGVLWRS